MKTKVLLIVFIIMVVSGCKTRTIIQEKVKIEYRDRWRTDIVYNSDTTNIYTKGDTVFQDVIRWRNRYVNTRDSVVLIDSIPYPVEVVEYVNKLTKWQKWRLQALNVLGGLLAAFIAFKLFIR